MLQRFEGAPDADAGLLRGVKVYLRRGNVGVPKEILHVPNADAAGHLMEAGVDIYTIKRWMGHTALVTTGRYARTVAQGICNEPTNLFKSTGAKRHEHARLRFARLLRQAAPRGPAQLCPSIGNHGSKQSVCGRANAPCHAQPLHRVTADPANRLIHPPRFTP
jgi:hypothetical protein